MSKRIMMFIGIAAGALVLAACSSSPSESVTTTSSGAPSGGSEVSIENFAFGPADLTVSVGDTITWTNNENGVPHTTTADDGLWDSSTMRPDDTFAFTFTEAGTFTYLCTIHPSMRATITVTG
ncbi:MAG: plastocyanin/azurin family copper-binding protein [Acidimicrobiia bacterium]